MGSIYPFLCSSKICSCLVWRKNECICILLKRYRFLVCFHSVWTLLNVSEAVEDPGLAMVHGGGDTYFLGGIPILCCYKIPKETHKISQQECIPVGCILTVAATVARRQYGEGCMMSLSVWSHVHSGGEGLTPGGSPSRRGSPSIRVHKGSVPNGQNDRRLWKDYLPLRSVKIGR